MKEFVVVFRNVRGLLSDPLHWTKGASARFGRVLVSVYDETANRFCMFGAFQRVCDDSFLRSQSLGMVRAEIQSPISDWNDSPNRTHADVLQLLDKLIAKCEAADV